MAMFERSMLRANNGRSNSQLFFTRQPLKEIIMNVVQHNSFASVLRMSAYIVLGLIILLGVTSAFAQGDAIPGVVEGVNMLYVTVRLVAGGILVIALIVAFLRGVDGNVRIMAIVVVFLCAVGVGFAERIVRFAMQGF